MVILEFVGIFGKSKRDLDFQIPNLGSLGSMSVWKHMGNDLMCFGFSLSQFEFSNFGKLPFYPFELGFDV